jgi:hypothetical protein
MYGSCAGSVMMMMMMMIIIIIIIHCRPVHDETMFSFASSQHNTNTKTS